MPFFKGGITLYRCLRREKFEVWQEVFVHTFLRSQILAFAMTGVFPLSIPADGQRCPSAQSGALPAFLLFLFLLADSISANRYSAERWRSGSFYLSCAAVTQPDPSGRNRIKSELKIVRMKKIRFCAMCWRHTPETSTCRSAQSLPPTLPWIDHPALNLLRCPVAGGFPHSLYRD